MYKEMPRKHLRPLIPPGWLCQCHSYCCKTDVTKMERRSRLPFTHWRKTSLFFQTGMNQCGVGLSKIPARLAITSTVVLPASGARADAGVFPTSQAQTASRPTHSFLKGGLVPCWVHELALRAFTCLLMAPRESLFQNPYTRDTGSLL